MVTIIMPVYNQLEFTKQAVESLQKFTNKDDYELIIVNNASTDGTKEYLQYLCNINKNISYLDNKENYGWIKALNQAYPLINSEFVLWANNDILFEEDWLPRMLKRFEDEKVGMVGPTSDYVAGLQSVTCNIQGLKTEKVKFLIGFFLMIRRDLMERIGQVDEWFGQGGGEELDYCIRVRQVGYELVIARDVFIKHFGSKTLRPYVGNTDEAYILYCEEKDNMLKEKWGDEVIKDLYTVGERLRIGWGLPLRTSYIHRLFMSSAVMLKKPGKWDLIDCPRQMVGDARNLIVNKAIELGCTHILFTDDDHLFPPDAVVRLLEYDVDIVGALAFQRKPDYLPCVFKLKDNNVHSVELINQGLQEVDAVGFAFVLIKIEIFNKLEKPWFVYGDKRPGIYREHGGLGEDLAFCINAKNVGFKIFCDTDLVVPHIGDELIVDQNVYFNHKEKAVNNNPIILPNGMKII